MAAFTSVTGVGQSRKDKLKHVTFTAVGPNTYDTSGSVLDLSRTGGLGLLGFKTRVDGCLCIGVNVGASASAKWVLTYVGATASAPATGLVFVQLLAQATPAEEGATDMHATTFRFIAWGE